MTYLPIRRGHIPRKSLGSQEFRERLVSRFRSHGLLYLPIWPSGYFSPFTFPPLYSFLFFGILGFCVFIFLLVCCFLLKVVRKIIFTFLILENPVCCSLLFVFVHFNFIITYCPPSVKPHSAFFSFLHRVCAVSLEALLPSSILIVPRFFLCFLVRVSYSADGRPDSLSAWCSNRLPFLRQRLCSIILAPQSHSSHI